MKKNSINKLVVLTSAISLMPINILMAQEEVTKPTSGEESKTKGRRVPGKISSGYSKTDSGNSSSSSGGGNGKTTNTLQTKVVEEKEAQPSLIKTVAAGAECDLDQEKSLAYPLEFFKSISRDQALPSIESREGNKIVVKFPAMLAVEACGDFKPEPYQDPKTKNVTIQFLNTKGLRYGEYLDCLDEKKVLVDNKIILDSDSARFKEYSYAFDYSFDPKEEYQKTLKLSVAYPKAFSGKYGFGSVFGKDNSVELPSKMCEEVEKISPDITYLNKGRDALIEELKAKCNSGDAQKIAEARRSIGNAEALKDIADVLKSKLDAAYLDAVQTDVDEIFKKMGKLEEEIKRTAKDMDESTARKKIDAYAELAKQLDEKFLNHAIYRLDNLNKQYVASEDAEERKKLSEEIVKLNASISKFSERSKKDTTAAISMFGLMEKFALTDQAKVIHDIQLKSELYGRVYPKGSAPESDKRGRPLSFAEANQIQAKRLDSFDRVLTDWSDIYLTSQGSMAPIKKVESSRNQVISKMNTRWGNYQQTEYKNYAQYCSVGMMGSVNNPVQCKTFLAGVEKRRQAELKRRDKDLAFIKNTDIKLSKMGIAYNKYQAEQVERATAVDDDSPYGASYSGFESTFEDRYPQYNGPTTSTYYDPSMVQYGQVGGAQNGFMPQTQYMNQGVTSFGSGVQQPMYGQYQQQMPQMMTYQGGASPYQNFGYMR